MTRRSSWWNTLMFSRESNPYLDIGPQWCSCLSEAWWSWSRGTSWASRRSGPRPPPWRTTQLVDFVLKTERFRWSCWTCWCWDCCYRCQCPRGVSWGIFPSPGQYPGLSVGCQEARCHSSLQNLVFSLRLEIMMWDIWSVGKGRLHKTKDRHSMESPIGDHYQWNISRRTFPCLPFYPCLAQRQRIDL